MNPLTASHATPLVQPLEEAPTHRLLGGTIAIRLRSEDTGGGMALLDYTAPAGFPGPALHVHPEFDEMYLVLEGTLSLRIEDRAVEAAAGTVAYVPRGTPHTFANASSEPVRMLVVLTPGGFERYFDALADQIDRLGSLPPAAELVALGIAHGSLPAA